MNMPPVFCISLARDTKRRARMSARLEELGVRYEMVDAVDGRALDLSALGDRLRQDKSMYKLRRELLPAEIGCYLSHYNLWQKIAAENIPAAVVVEDDAVFSADFPRIVAAADIPYEWDVIILHAHSKYQNSHVLCKLNALYSLHRANRAILCTTAYLVSLRGAKKLLTEYREISAVADRTFSAYWHGDIKLYFVHPRVVNADDSPTNIAEYNNLQTRKRFSYWHIAHRVWRFSESVKRRIWHLRNPFSRETVRAKENK